MHEQPRDSYDLDELDAELEQLSAEGLRVEAVDPQTGERRLEGLVSREHLAQAVLEREGRSGSV
jgi:hypothetical protein